VIVGVVLVAFAGLAGQLGNLTLRQQQAYLARAESQSTRSLSIPAPRGGIYDRNMEPLAVNRPSYKLLVHYPSYNDAALVDKLAQILKLAPEEAGRRVDQQKDRPFEPVQLADDLSQEQYTEIQEQKQELPGVEVQVVPVRQYSRGDLAAQVLGYVGTLNQAELQQLEPKGYNSGDLVGRTGLEAHYESVLRGQPGERAVEVNSSSEPLAVVGNVEPKPGLNLVLSLNAKLQQSAERALDWQMQRLQTIPNVGDGRAYQNARAGAAVVLDVKTGAVLAMASRPSYDPNLFVGGISASDWNALNKNPFEPLLNRAVQGAYHPGSTWKMLTGSAAVTAGVITPSERVFSGSVYTPTGQKDWVPGGHGWVDLVNALRLSSDIYFYEIGLRLGIERQVAYAKSFGFGALTGVDLDEEVPGFLPDSDYRSKNGWWPGETSSAAIGQIFTATPLQLARYVAALANGGKLMKPYLVQRVEDGQGQVVRQTSPEQTGTLPITSEALETVVEGMKLVNLPGGTSDFATWPLPGIPTAGKTGTAENPPQDDFGLFVGFAPAENPQIAVAVVIEQAGHGGSVSPVARSIFADYFGVKLPAGDPARVPNSGGA
jgi:penicillin-binding protein 2